jgi:hypothetical protein
VSYQSLFMTVYLNKNGRITHQQQVLMIYKESIYYVQIHWLQIQRLKFFNS